MKALLRTMAVGALCLAHLGLPSPCRAEEGTNPVGASLGGTTLSGYVDTSVPWGTQPAVQGIPEPSPRLLLAAGGLVLGCLALRPRRSKQRRSVP